MLSQLRNTSEKWCIKGGKIAVRFFMTGADNTPSRGLKDIS